MNKYEWLEAVMASKLNTGTKVFAFGLFKHMNDGGTCYPGDDALVTTTGMGRGHFAKYRRTLLEAGWIVMEPRKTKNGNSYMYSIPQSATEGGIQNAPDGDESATEGGIQNAPDGDESATEGEQNAPDGEQNASDGEQNATVGGMNTVYNTTNNTGTNPVGEHLSTPTDSSPSIKEVEDSRQDEVDVLLTDEGASWLETLVLRNRLNQEHADAARTLYADKTFKPKEDGVQRAVLAVWGSKKWWE